MILFDKLSTKVDKDVDINLKLSMNFILEIIVLSSLDYFLIGTENVMYFSLFSSKHSKSPSNSSANPFMIKS